MRNYTLGDFGAITSTNDFTKGREFLWYFHWYSKDQYRYPNYTFKTVDDLVKHYDSKYAGSVAGLGKTLRVGEVTTEEMKKAASAMAKLGKGRIPARITYFGEALVDAARVTWVGALPTAIADSAKVIAKGVMETGESVITTGKVFKTIMPLIPILLIGAVVYKIVKTPIDYKAIASKAGDLVKSGAKAAHKAYKQRAKA